MILASTLFIIPAESLRHVIEQKAAIVTQDHIHRASAQCAPPCLQAAAQAQSSTSHPPWACTLETSGVCANAFAWVLVVCMHHSSVWESRCVQSTAHEHMQASNTFSHKPPLICSYAQGYASQWDNFFTQIEPLASRIPWMMSPGNHERSWPGSKDRCCCALMRCLFLVFSAEMWCVLLHTGSLMSLLCFANTVSRTHL